MLRQKIDWEKVPWLMTKVKVSEEYYVNYWRHRPFQREWEGEEKPGSERKKGLQSRCHQDTGPQAPISCHLSSAQTSSPHFLFGLHDVTKEEKNLSTLAWMQPKSGVRAGSGWSEAARRKPKGSLGARTWACLVASPSQFPLFFGARTGVQTGRAGVFLCVWSPAVFARPWCDTRSSLHGPAGTTAGTCPAAPLPRKIFNPIHAHGDTLDRRRRRGQMSPLPNSSQGSLFSLLAQPHTVAPGHTHTRPQYTPSLDRT